MCTSAWRQHWGDISAKITLDSDHAQDVEDVFFAASFLKCFCFYCANLNLKKALARTTS